MNLQDYQTLRDEVIAAGYQREIDWSSSDRTKGLTPEVLALEAAWVIVNSGMKFRVAEKIWKVLRPALLAGRSAHSAFGHDGKATAIDYIWSTQTLLLDSFRRADDPIAWCQTLPWIGPTTKYHLAKNLGVDCAKPDRHLMRLAERAGKSVEALCSELSEASGDNVATVDMVLWRAAELGLA